MSSPMHQNIPVLENKKLEQSKIPTQYGVKIWNDDYTTFDIVIDIVMTVFRLSHEEAELHTYNIHSAGSVVIGSFTREIAETKAMQCNEIAKANEHPLLSNIEEL